MKRLFVMLCVACLAKPALAQELAICNAVLRVGPTDTEASYEFDSQVYTYGSLLCNERFSEYSSASAFAAKAGISIPLVDAIFNFSGEAKSNKATFTTEYYSFCSQLDEESFRTRVINRLRVTHRDIVFSSWLSCIDTLALRLGRFAYIQAQDEIAAAYTVNFRFDLPQRRPITAWQIQPTALQCTYGGNPISQTTEIDRESFAIECTKPSNRALIATIETSEGTFENIQFPSQVEQDPTAELRRELLPQVVPRGAVLAFDATQCPAGWSPYLAARGRVVVGMLSELDANAGLSARPVGSQGGAEQVKIGMENMPAHQHGTQAGVQPGNDTSGNSGVGLVVFGAGMGQALMSNTTVAGSSDPVPLETMPPYVSLLYCIKG